MAGLIQANMPQGGVTNAGITPDSIMAHLHLNPQQKQQLMRIVVAGKKVMFSQQSHQLMLQQLQGPGPMPQKLGQGIAGLLGLLVQQSKNSLPGQLLIPAGMVLLAEAADFLKKAGQPISDQDIGQAMQIMVNTVLQQGKIDPDKVAAIAQRGSVQQPGAGAAPAAPGATPQGV